MINISAKINKNRYDENLSRKFFDSRLKIEDGRLKTVDIRQWIEGNRLKPQTGNRKTIFLSKKSVFSAEFHESITKHLL